VRGATPFRACRERRTLTRLSSNGSHSSSSTSRSNRLRKPAAVAAFGAQATHAQQLRELGDSLDDIVFGLRQRDPLVDGIVRKLLADWRELGDPLLFYALEIRSSGKLVLAAETERGRFVLPAYQAGLRALTLTPATSAEAVLALCAQLMRLEDGALSYRAFYEWLWEGNPEGLAVLLGHAISALPSLVLERAVPPSEVWAAHSAAAAAEWSALAKATAEQVDGRTIASTYRQPVEHLFRNAAQLALSNEQLDALRSATNNEDAFGQLEDWLVLGNPELARWLTPERAAQLAVRAVAADKAAELLRAFGAMSPEAIAAALVECPALLGTAPRRYEELLAPTDNSARSAPLVRALLAQGGAGAKRLGRALLGPERDRVPESLVQKLWSVFVDVALGAELVLPAWTSRTSNTASRIYALHALARDPDLLGEALRLRPLEPSEPIELKRAYDALRGQAQ
jgi:hypothetical protein